MQDLKIAPCSFELLGCLMADETEVASRQRGSRVGKRKITIRVACSRHSTRVVCGIHGFALRNVLSLLYH